MLDQLISAAVFCIMTNDWAKDELEELHRAVHYLEMAQDEKHDDDAVVWIIKNQFGRRNLSAYDRSLLALKLKPVIAAKAKENQGERTDLTSVRNLTNVDTKKEIAKAAGVSHDTIAKVERIEQKATPEIKACPILEKGREEFGIQHERICRRDWLFVANGSNLET